MLLQESTSGAKAAALLSGTPISYRLERMARFEHGSVEVGRYAWTAPLRDVELCQSEEFSINLALSPRSPQLRIAMPGNEAGVRVSRLFLAPPGSRLRLTAPSGQVRTIQCAIDRGRLEHLLGRAIGPADCNLAIAGRKEARTIEFLLNRIYDELREDRLAAQLAIDGYAAALCVELARCFGKGGDTAPPRGTGGLPPWIMRRLDERLAAEGPAPRLEELARLSGLTVRQLGRAFKVETGTTLGKHVEAAVLRRACRLLTETALPVGQVASLLGFASGSAFTYAFRRAKGLSPSAFRLRGRA